MFFCLICIVISKFISIIWQSYWLYSINARYDDLIYNLAMLATLGIIMTILGIVILVLAIVSFYKFHQGRYEFGETHFKNIDLAKKFLILYVILWVISMIAIPILTFFAIHIAITLSTIINIASSFLFCFMILHLVKELAGSRERELLYLFCGIEILGPIISSFLNLTVFFSMIYGSGTGGASTTISIVFSLIYIGSTCLAILAFSNIGKDMRTNGTNLTKDHRAKFPRPRAVSRYGWAFFSRPVRAFLAVFIVALILGSSYGAGTYYVFYRPMREAFEDSNRNEVSEGISDGSGGFTSSESLMEGEEYPISESIHEDVTEITILLIWTDEADNGFRTNEPDGFRLDGDIGIEPKTQSQENPRGGQGEIVMVWSLDEPLYILSVDILVTLEYAGDQVGPLGIGASPVTIEDNSNTFDLSVDYTYIP